MTYDFQLNTEGLDTNTATITDYDMISENVARVIVAFTGNMSKQQKRNKIAEIFNGRASPIESSFHKLDDNSVIGYVRTNKEILVLSSEELNASYQLVASNMFMSNKDKTLWSKKEGNEGTIYLSRQGEEDLEELVSLAKIRRAGIPTLGGIENITAAKSTILAFINSEGSVDYGFATRKNDDQTEIVSVYSHSPVVVKNTQLVASYPVQIDSEQQKSIEAKMDKEAKTKAVEYWKQYYKYAPEYLKEVINAVEELSWA